MADYREENETYGRKLYANSGEDDLDAAKKAAIDVVKCPPATCPDCGEPCTYTPNGHEIHVCVQGHEWR